MKLDPDWTSQSMDRDRDLDRDSGCPGSPHLPNKVSDVPKDLLRTFPHTKRVGNYLLGRTLGEGSFAKVKEGLHTITGEKVAVKVIDKKKAREDVYVRKNLRREGRLLQQVRNRYVVQLYEIMETENSYYLVMELCEGGDLMDLICSRKKLDERDTRRFIRQVVCAVDYLHKAGILHRDLKVENLLLDSNKDIKLIDFGLSNAVRVSHTKEGSTFQEFCVTQCGSPAYAAPELLGNKKYGPKVDVWSIGVNMFAMLTGNLPFTVEPFNIKTLHNKMLNGDMNPIPDHVSANCRDLLRKFLVADPDKRITLKEAMEHPWLTESRNRPPEMAPFPNKLCADDLENGIVMHMSQNLDFRLSDVIRLTTANIPNTATATYNLFLRKLNRYTADMRVQGKVAAAEARMVASNRRHQVVSSRAPKTSDVIDLLPLSNPKDLKSQPVAVEKQSREGSQDPKILDMTMSPRKTKPTDKITYRRRLSRNQVDRPNVAASKPHNVNGTIIFGRQARPGHQGDSHPGDCDAKPGAHLREQVQLYQIPGATQGTTVKKVGPDSMFSSSPESTQPELFHHDDPKEASKTPSHDLPPITGDKTFEKAPQGLLQTRAVPGPTTKTSNNSTNYNRNTNGVTVENSSQSTTSSCNDRHRQSTSSGPGPLTYRKPVRPSTKPATVSDPSTKKERKIAQTNGGSTSLRSSPKRITIDLNSHEVFSRNAGKATTTTTAAVTVDWQDRVVQGPQTFLYQGFNRNRTFGPRPLVKKKSVPILCESNLENNNNNNDSNKLTLVSVNVSAENSNKANRGQHCQTTGLTGRSVLDNPMITPRIDKVITTNPSKEQVPESSLPAAAPVADNNCKTLVFPAISPPLVSTKTRELK